MKRGFSMEQSGGQRRHLAFSVLAGLATLAPGMTASGLGQEQQEEPGAPEAVTSGQAAAEDHDADDATPQEASGEAPAAPDSAGGGYFLGNGGGARDELAASGVTLDLQWTHYGQGVVDGGLEEDWEYGATAEVLTSFDLGKLGLVPGGFFTFRGEGRYGDSVIADAGTILPVNTDFFMPVTRELDDDIFTITELSYTQFLSDQFAVFGGKLQTLDGDPNEFASGRGRSQFMNFNFVAPNLMGLAAPYSNLGAGVLILPTEKITISTLFMNTAEASTRSGFDDFGDGTSWLTEAQF